MTPWPRRAGDSDPQSGTQSTRRQRSNACDQDAGQSAVPDFNEDEQIASGPAGRFGRFRGSWLLGAGAALVVGALIAAFALTGLAGADRTLAQPAPAAEASAASTPKAGGGESTPTSAAPEASTPADPDHSSASPSPDPVAKRSKQAKLAAVPKIPNQGPGTYKVAHLTSKPVGKAYARRLRYAVRVEKNLPYDPDEIAALVVETLGDQRSWIGSGEARLQLVADPNRADFTINLATPGTVDRTCWPLRTWGRLSCQAGNRVMLNAWRWAHGAKAYGHDLTGYRRYLINHEVGHRLGHGHVGCPAKGRRAPVMMQQTKGVGSCRANPWPDPSRTPTKSEASERPSATAPTEAKPEATRTATPAPTARGAGA